MAHQERDQLSELPNSLILVILSLLPMRDVVATMLLSKRWKDLWTTVPCLDFRYSELMLDYNLEKFKNFVCGALALWKGSKILKFCINFCIDHYHITSDIVDSWLLFPIENQVEELLIIAGSTTDFEYAPPQSLYSSSSITKLYLHSCKLEIDEDVQWNRLKSLQMYGSKSSSEEAMTKVISGAHVLDDLILCFYEIHENLNIQSTSLKSLIIGNHSWSYIGTIYKAVLRIRAANLLTLGISGFFYGSDCLLDVPSLTDATLCFKESCQGEIYANLPPIDMFYQVFQSVRHVETVTLSCLSIQFLLRMKKENMMTSFSNVKVLNFYPDDAIGMLDVLDLFPELMILRAQLDPDICLELDIDARFCKVDVIPSYETKADFPVPFLPCLKTVEITWYMRDPAIIPAIEVLLENAHVLDKLMFRPLWYDCADREVLLSTVTSSPTAEVIIIKV